MPSILSIPRSTLDVVTVVDPAISEKVSAARTAVVTVAVDPKYRIFIFPSVVGRFSPTELIERTIGEAKKWNSRIIGIESVAYQRALGHFIEKRMSEIGFWWPVKMLVPDRLQKKEGRIRGRLHGYFANRQVYISAGDFELIHELEEFPLGRTNDILDALAYAPELWRQPETPPNQELEKSLERLPAGDQRYWKSFHRQKRGESPEDELDVDSDERSEEVGVFELLRSELYG